MLLRRVCGNKFNRLCYLNYIFSYNLSEYNQLLLTLVSKLYLLNKSFSERCFFYELREKQLVIEGESAMF